MRLVLAVLAVSALPMSGQPVQIWADTEIGRMTIRFLVGALGDEEFQLEAIELLDSDEIRVGLVSLYGSLEDYNERAPGQARSLGEFYERWRERLDRARPGCIELKQVWKWESGMVFRSSDRDCSVHRQVLRGETDPLVLTVGGEKLELLWMMSRWANINLWTHVFARTDAKLTEGLAQRFLDEVVRTTGAKHVSLSIRNDSWFVTESEFPLAYPFNEQPVRIPAKEEFLESPRAACLQWPGLGSPACSCRNCEE